MTFPESVIISRFTLSGGRCECRGDHPQHRGSGRCRARFGRNEGWVAAAIDPRGSETMKNCQLICPDCNWLNQAVPAVAKA
jgi:hypothetical protein